MYSLGIIVIILECNADNWCTQNTHTHVCVCVVGLGGSYQHCQC